MYTVRRAFHTALLAYCMELIFAISYGETCEYGAGIHEAAVCHCSYYVGPPRYECQKIILREKTTAPIETKLSIPSLFHRNQQNSLYLYTNKNEKLLFF